MSSLRPLSLAARRAARAAAALTLLATAACEGDDELSIGDEPAIGTVILTVTPVGSGGTQYTWSGGATVTPTLRIPIGTSTISAIIRDDAGATLNDDLAADLELRMTASSDAIDYTRSNTNPFAGAITATAAANQSVTLCIYHRNEGRCEFGSTSTAIPVVVGN